MKTMHFLILLAILLISPAFAFSQAVDDHTVLLLNFDENSLVMEGGELAKVKDLSGNENDALVNTQGGEPGVRLNVKPSGPPQVVEGKFGKSLYFDGTNFLEVVSSESVEITDQITLEAWIKPDVLTTGADSMTVLTKDCAYYMVLRDNGILSNYLYGANPPGYHMGKGALKVNEWTHIAITYDGKKVLLYINGQVETEIGAQGEILVSGCGDPQSIGIGCEVRIPARGEPNQRYYKGAIDEIRISKIARSADQIKQSIANGLRVSIEPVGKLATMWSRIKAKN